LVLFFKKEHARFWNGRKDSSFSEEKDAKRLSFFASPPYWTKTWACSDMFARFCCCLGWLGRTRIC
jgi:hypothetical protein